MSYVVTDDVSSEQKIPIKVDEPERKGSYPTIYNDPIHHCVYILRKVDSFVVDIVVNGQNAYIEIDDLRVSVCATSHPELIPDILFYNVPQHVRLLKELFKDVLLKQNILLIGNQGVGKNKLGE